MTLSPVYCSRWPCPLKTVDLAYGPGKLTCDSPDCRYAVAVPVTDPALRGLVSTDRKPAPGRPLGMKRGDARKRAA